MPAEPEEKLIESIKSAGYRLRALMDPDERRIANKLCKHGLIHKGTGPERRKPVAYYVNDLARMDAKDADE